MCETASYGEREREEQDSDVMVGAYKTSLLVVYLQTQAEISQSLRTNVGRYVINTPKKAFPDGDYGLCLL